MQWKVCPSFLKHEVSEFGDVRRIVSGRPLKSRPDKGGYARFAFRVAGKQRLVSASRLVIEAFVGPKPFDGAEVCHNDGTRSNDHYTNLRWDSRKGNAADRVVHGTETIGELNGKAKLTAEDVMEIRYSANLGESQKRIGARFNVGQSIVSDIVNRKCWAHVN